MTIMSITIFNTLYIEKYFFREILKFKISKHLLLQIIR